MELIRDKLKKIKKLLNSDYSGERENAKRLLNDLSKKYKIAIDDLEDTELKIYKIKVKNNFEKRLLKQILIYVIQTITFRYADKKQTLYFEATFLQYTEIKECFKYYKPLLETYFNDMFTAFVHRYNLFADDIEVKKDKTMDIQREERIISFLNGMNENAFNIRRLIEN